MVFDIPWSGKSTKASWTAIFTLAAPACHWLLYLRRSIPARTGKHALPGLLVKAGGAGAFASLSLYEPLLSARYRRDWRRGMEWLKEWAH